MSITVVRKKTEFFVGSRNSLNIRIKLIPVKSLSFGYQPIEDDISNSDAETVLNRILNINDVNDGIYKIVSCNHFTDKDTGYVESWNYRLIPYVKKPESNKEVQG